ncbi:thiamine pyrophosphate-dependent dehydrogenase E1 component subunit alpha [Amycolatopsis acidiphila]|uniref:Thiamine pyrophosphate-dependent dehydrogenase E1 component subunit alpha n=1 Tax=Amycolatopsis acidiphila TaxID=715473 RepID=A0A558AFK9_9PSEU|nr:thiamine pyrophosphate-dependent dehydrogenase E1 component subunit alpha [Amycolatopsis acidiphila]TVT23006.1 thiamine pyrophosphate-dependent dehydrogenase E1 component subunit alpha [Amycolatopsis acidiphila]UIJ57174.1 thiamine pyrophosphate-dependent dehydrogenase E1 component subunit alpha [Amycolatopsis acidiphila]GHG52882.1 acetoin:2,6-dichlorophenolindophenol oxidoreductase subunit alpha [Amycolatopsis acidiphila]
MTTSPEATAVEGVDGDVLAGIYTTAVKIKLYDEKYRATMRAGKIGGMYYSPRGQEIIPSAISAVLAPEDYVLTIYRGVHDQIAKGVPLRTLTAEFFGRASGSCKGKGGPMHITDPSSGLIVTTGVVGSGMPIGVGVALSAHLRKSGQVTVVNFGDGASNIGAFHEALNLASVWNLPVVFVCQNNRYAEYTTLADGTSVERIADRGAAYSMRSIHVDGNDPEAMYGAARTAIDAARAGDGPTLVEAMTYRFFGHVMGDGMEYMPEEELRAAMEADPVVRMREKLLAAGHRSEAELTRVEDGLRAEIEDAFEYAMSQPMAEPEELTTDVYAEGAIR